MMSIRKHLQNRTGVSPSAGGWLLLALLSGCGRSQFATAAPDTSHLKNVAQGSSYTMKPAPNYAGSTDADDSRQLTDGQYTSGYFWTSPSTVGWKSSGFAPVVITIDLGQVRAIRGVSFNTAMRPQAGAYWPKAINVLLSDDGKAFREAGDLVKAVTSTTRPPEDKYNVYRFVRTDLKARGRYVSFVVEGYPFVFVDEIEVYEGESSWLAQAPSGRSVADDKEFFTQHKTRQGVERRLQRDAQNVRQAVSRAALPAQTRQAILKILPASNASTVPTQARLTFPLNEAHRRIFAAQARLWQATGRAPLTVWQTPLWNPLPLNQAPPQKASGVALRYALMRGADSRAAQFNISNAGTTAKSLRLRFEGLPGGAQPGYLKVHTVAWTDTQSGVPVAAALPEAEREAGAYAISVVPGLTRQVWITARGGNLPPGLHRGRAVLSGGAAPISIPVELRVFASTMPSRTTLALGGWDYTNQDKANDVTPAVRSQVIRFLQEHGVNAPWATSSVMPFGRYSSAGQLRTAPDTQRFESWLRDWPAARVYCVFLNVGSSSPNSLRGTPQFEQRVLEWANFWAAQAQARGLRPGQLLLLLVDEPQRAAQNATLAEWARVLKRSALQARVWENPIHQELSTLPADMVEAIDVWSPDRNHFIEGDAAFRQFFRRQQQNGKTLHFYQCSGPATLLDPYSYYRLQAWTCWQWGATGEHFWSFSDGGGTSSWNEYEQRQDSYIPYFLDANGVTSGKHMEAIREGVQDYEYLVMLRARLLAAQKRLGSRAGGNSVVQKAGTLLREAAGRVCEAPDMKQAIMRFEAAQRANTSPVGPRTRPTAFQWSQPINRDVADVVRVEILTAISQLDKLK